MHSKLSRVQDVQGPRDALRWMLCTKHPETMHDTETLRHLMIVQKQILILCLCIASLAWIQVVEVIVCIDNLEAAAGDWMSCIAVPGRSQSPKVLAIWQETFRFSMFLGWIHCEFTFHLWCPFAQIWSPFLHLWHVRNAGCSLDILVLWYSRLYALKVLSCLQPIFYSKKCIVFWRLQCLGNLDELLVHTVHMYLWTTIQYPTYVS